MRRTSLAIVLLFYLVFAGVLQAQRGDRLVILGLAAYRALDYDSAAILFRQGFEATGRDSVTTFSRPDLLTYIGSAEFLRGDSSRARNSFVRALAINPMHRIDDLLFPPSVTQLFESARASTAYLTVAVPSDTTIRVFTQKLPVTVYSSAAHPVVVAMTRPNGYVVKQIFAGEIKDSVTLYWDGTDATNQSVVDTELLLTVRTAQPVAHGGESTMRLAIRPLRVDTIPHPLRPNPSASTSSFTRSSSLSGTRAIAAGMLAGSAAIFLPSIIGKGGNPMPERYVVGAALGTVGILGFVRARSYSQQGKSDSIAFARRLDAWRRDVNLAREENARRLRNPSLRIITGQTTPPGFQDKW